MRHCKKVQACGYFEPLLFIAVTWKNYMNNYQSIIFIIYLYIKYILYQYNNQFYLNFIVND